MSETGAAVPGDEAEGAAARRGFVRASVANVLGNAVKIAVEAAAGVAFGSVALLADAAHSVADLVASAVVLIWGRNVYADPDATHPHGHQRIEPLAALFVGSVVVLLGLNLLYDSVRGLIAGPTVRFSPLLIAALGFAMVDMYLLYRYTTRINATVNSAALAALAVDCRNDIYTSVAALIGVGGVLVGVPELDAVAGGLVSALVVYQGVEIGRENVSYLIGAAPSDEQRRRITETLRAHPSVSGVHDLVVFYDGTDLEVEAHVEVDGGLTLVEAHDIETELVATLGGLEDVGDVHLHLDPAGIGEWKETSERRSGGG